MRRPTRASSRAAAIALLLIATTGCQYLQFLPFIKRQEDLRPRGRSATRHGPAYAPATSAAPDPLVDWPAYNNTLDGARWSPLAQITSANASTLGPVCTAHLGERTSMQSGPVVVAGTMYVTTAKATYAFDAATCARRWMHRYAYAPKPDYDLRVNARRAAPLPRRAGRPRLRARRADGTRSVERARRRRDARRDLSRRAGGVAGPRVHR
jgi:glucose dehydrogenase